MIEAELPDGTILEFPDGTDPSVIQRTVKRVLGVGDVVEDPLADERTVGGQTFEFGKAIARGFGNTFVSAGEGVGELSDAATNLAGFEGAIDDGDDNALVAASREGRQAIDEYLGADEAYRDTWITKFGEGIGSFATFFTPAAALRLAGLAGKGAKILGAGATGTLAVGSGTGTQMQQVEAARARGIDVSEDQEDTAAILSGIVGLSELAAPTRLLKRIDADGNVKLPKGYREVLGSALRTGGVEATQEVLASIAQNAIEKGVYNEDAELLGPTLYDEFTVGGAVGAGADLVVNAIAGRRNKANYDSALEKEQAKIKEREDFLSAGEIAQQDADLSADLDIERGAALIDEIAADIEAQQQLEGRRDVDIEADVSAAARDRASTIKPRGTVDETALEISRQMGRAFPSKRNTFSIQDNGDSFSVVDAEGYAYSQPVESRGDAAALAGALNRQVELSNVYDAGEAVVESSPNVYDDQQKKTLRRYNIAANDPEQMTFIGPSVDAAAETTVDRGFYEGEDTVSIIRDVANGVRPEARMTASQRINRRRMEQGLPLTNNFTLEEVKEELGDKFPNIVDTRLNGLVETESYRIEDRRKKNATVPEYVVVSSAGEVIRGRKLNLKEKQEYLETGADKKNMPRIKRFGRDAGEAQAFADKLNANIGIGRVDESVYRDKFVARQFLQNILDAKNIISPIDSPELQYLAERFAGVAPGTPLSQMSDGEFKMFAQKMRSLPRFDSPTVLPVFKLKPYTGDQFRRAVAALKENPDMGPMQLGEAIGDFQIDGDVSPTALDSLLEDAKAQGVTKTEQEPLLLEGPSIDQRQDIEIQQFESALAKQMQGMNVGDVPVNVSHALRNVLRDANGNLVYGIRKRNKNEEVDPELVVGGTMGSQRFVRDDVVDPNALEGQLTEGFYHPDMNQIFLSVDAVANDPALTDQQIESRLADVLNHEMIHAMRMMDLFTKSEWKILSGRAGVLKKGNQTYTEWAAKSYEDLNPVQQMEEAVAEMVRDQRAKPSLVSGKPANLLRRATRFMSAMKNALDGSGFRSFEGIIDDISSGRVGSRPRGEVRTLQFTEREAGVSATAPGQVIPTTGAEDEQSRVGKQGGPRMADFIEQPVFSRGRDIKTSQVRELMDSSPITQQFLDPERVDYQFRDAVDPSSRSTVTMMTPNEFLKLAATGVDRSKTERVDAMAAAGQKFQPNFLQFTANERGAASITGHEGRHRARYYASQGYGDTLMPVTLTSVGGRAGELRFGESDARPSALYKEDDRDFVDIISRSSVYDPDEKAAALEGRQLKFPKTIPFDLYGFTEDGIPMFDFRPVLKDRDYTGPVFSRKAKGQVSTRFPTAVRRTEDPLDDLLVNDYQAFTGDKPVFTKNMALIKDASIYPILRKDRALRTDEQKAESFVETVKDNLLYIYDMVDPSIRETSKLWYEGANKLAQRMASKHNISLEQASAVLANLSPQKDWYMNASLGERTADIFFEQADTPFNGEMMDTAKRLYLKKDASAKSKAISSKILPEIDGKTINEILAGDPDKVNLQLAYYIRTYDETYNSRAHRIISPDGTIMDYVKTVKGEDAGAGWGSMNEIAKAVVALRSNDIDVISSSLGTQNKVRNFYNNIFDPQSDLGFVTIDTHAVAAGLLQPLSGKSEPVIHNFGGGVVGKTGASSSKITGINGTYSLFEEAYRRAAAERGVLAREMQSITWEAIRGVFSPSYKNNEDNVKFVDNVWRQYNKRLIDLDKARQEVLLHASAGQIPNPDWADRPRDAVPQGEQPPTYEDNVSYASVSRPEAGGPAFSRRGSGASRADTGLARKRIPDGQVKATVEANAEKAKDFASGYAPKINPSADPYAQAVAADPEKGQKLSREQQIMFSRGNEPERPGDVQRTMDKLVANPANITPGETYLNVLERGPIRNFITRLKQGTVFRYAQFEALEKTLDRDVMASSAALPALMAADRSNAIAGAAIKYGNAVYKDGRTTVEDFSHTFSADSSRPGETVQFRGLAGVMGLLFNDKGSLEKDAQAYAIARRAEGLRKRGIDSPGTPEEQLQIIQYVERNHPEIKDWYEVWQAYNAKTIQFLRDTGVLDAEMAEIWAAQSDYVPFYRQAEGRDVPNAPNMFGGLTTAGSFKGITGTDTALNVPLLDAITTNMAAAISMGMNNVAQQRVVRNMVRYGLAYELPKGKSGKGLNVVTFRVQGKDRKFVIEDPLVFTSLQPMEGGAGYDFLNTIFGVPANILRETVTRAPPFVAANMMRDTLSAYQTSGASFVPIIDTLRGFAKDMSELERSGVVGGYDFSKDPADIGKFMTKQLRDQGAIKDDRAITTKLLMKIWDGLGDVTTRSDFATRKAVHDDVLARTGDRAEAEFQALEVMNFGRRGSHPVMRLLTTAVPFLNARIQGLDLLLNAATGVRSSNKELSRRKAFGSFVARAGILAGASAMYYLLVSDSEDYQEATEEERDNNWIIPMPGDIPALKYPIPFEVGLLFKTLPERMMRSMTGDTTGRQTRESLQRAVVSTLEVPVTGPQIVAPLIETIANYNGFTGRAIVPQYMSSGLAGEAQVLSSTSEVAKLAAEFAPFDLSPIKMDHLIRGYTGTIGSYVLAMSDAALRSEFLTGDQTKILPARPVYDSPLLRRFFTREFGAGRTEEFYDMAGYVDQVYKTYNKLRKDGKLDQAERYIAGREYLLPMYPEQAEIRRGLSRLRKEEQAIRRMDISPEEKQERIREVEIRKRRYLEVVPLMRQQIEIPAFDVGSGLR